MHSKSENDSQNLPPSLFVDLDKTLLEQEILVELARSIGRHEAMGRQTGRAMRGEESFLENFSRRIRLLEDISVETAVQVVKGLRFRNELLGVMRCWPGPVAIVTSNLDCWVSPLLLGLGFPFYCSTAETNGVGQPIGVRTLLHKRGIVEAASGPTIFVGDGANDAEAIAASDLGVGFWPDRQVVSSVLMAVQYIFTSEERLCMFLRQRSSLTPPDGGVD